jgi:hypothetical protein
MLGRPVDKKLMKVQTKPVTPFVKPLGVGFLVAATNLLKITKASAKQRWWFSTMHTISLRVCTVEQRLDIHPKNFRIGC